MKGVIYRLGLEKHFHQANYEVNREMLAQIRISSIDDIIQRQLALRLSTHVINEYKDLIKATNEPNKKRFSLGLFIAEQGKMKEIIESIIRELPQSIIDDIRNHKPLYEKEKP